MADISKIKTPNGTTYDIVDRGARELIAASQIINSASGAIVSFSDGADDIPVRRLSVDLEPVQDLHGYDKPWPAGGGKNLFGFEKWLSDNEIAYTKTGNSYTFTLAQKLFTQPFIFSETDAEVTLSFESFSNGTSIDARITLLDSSNSAVGTIYADTTNVKITRTACKVRMDWRTGGAGTVTIKAPQIELGSTATAYAPYSNICPISGWDAVTVTKTGKNLFDISQFATQYPFYCSFSDGVLSVSANSILYYKGISADIPAGSFLNYAVEYGTATNVRIRLVYDDDTIFDISIPPYRIPKHVKALRFNWSNNGTFLLKNFQVGLGSTATDYEPYQGNTYTITFPSEAGTVYGGTLDVVSGELVVDRAMVDLGTLTWLYRTSWASFGVFTREQSEAKTFVAESKLNCSDYSQTATNASSNAETVALMSDGQIQIKQGSKQIYIRDSRYTDATVFKAAMQGVQLVYELATPQTHHLTSQEVRTLLGTNNVWSDANSVFVEYDTKNSVVAFTSSDVADGDASSWTTVTKVASGEKRSSLFAKMSQMFKNIRYLYKLLGTTDISSIGDGTVTGGLSSLAESQQAQKQLYIQQLKDLCLFAEIANGN